MAVIVTREENGTAVNTIAFGDADGYAIDSGILCVTQRDKPRASFRDWREVFIADADEVDDVLKAIASSAAETPPATPVNDGR